MPAQGGTVTISPDDPLQPAGMEVTLRAVPAEGYKFVTWGGGIVSPTTTAVVIVGSNMKVTASFVPVGY